MFQLVVRKCKDGLQQCRAQERMNQISSDRINEEKKKVQY